MKVEIHETKIVKSVYPMKFKKGYEVFIKDENGEIAARYLCNTKKEAKEYIR